MNYVRALFAALSVSAAVIGCGGGGGGGGDSGGDTGIVLSASQLAPGEILTIQHSQIVADSTIQVTFKGAGGYVVTATTALTANGSARIPVPPFLDKNATTATGAFTAGDVMVSVAGISSEKPLRIKELPPFSQGTPGDTLRAVLQHSIQTFQAAKQKIAATAAETGLDATALLSAINQQLAGLQAMDAELASSRQVTFSTGGAPYVLKGAELALAERLLAANIFGAAASLGITPATASTIAPQAENPVEAMLLAIRNQGIPGAQTLGSYLSVVAGVGGAVSAIWTGPVGPLVGGVASIAITGLTSGVTAVVAWFTEVSLDAVRGNDIDTYRADQRAADIFAAGFRSAALTFLGIIEWPVSWMGWVSIGNDLRDTINSLRDLQCQAYDRQAYGGVPLAPIVVIAATPENFCRETSGPTCPSVFRCRNGTTICADRVCNETADCSDGSDESPSIACNTAAGCCVATQGCPSETATTCALTCCCCPYGQVCDRTNWSHGCVGAARGERYLKRAEQTRLRSLDAVACQTRALLRTAWIARTDSNRSTTASLLLGVAGYARPPVTFAAVPQRLARRLLAD